MHSMKIAKMRHAFSDLIGLNGRLGLKAGEWVVVRSKEEILATLDAQARLEGMPFQPEMLAFCGRLFQVYKSAHKTCDTIDKTGSRRVPDAVHLEGVRCDGSEHRGCQGGCLMFWKEAWLRRVDDPRRPETTESPPLCTESLVRSAATAAGSSPSDPDPTWVCQTTALLEMSKPLKWWDVRQYIADIRSGNHPPGKIFKMFSFAAFRFLLRPGIGHRILLQAYDRFQALRGGRPYPHAKGTIPLDQPTPTEFLDLRVGETVRVKPLRVILATLNVYGRNRGMWFDQEMAKFCGREFPVEQRIERLIDEKTGKMLTMKNPCIQLRGAICEGECTADRLGCPRAINSYWREIWLERA